MKKLTYHINNHNHASFKPGCVQRIKIQKKMKIKIERDSFQKNTAFNIGEVVYLVTDPDQYERMITGILVRDSSIIYYASFIGQETHHYEFEISREKNHLKTLTN